MGADFQVDLSRSLTESFNHCQTDPHYTFTVPELNFGSELKVSVRARNVKNSSLEDGKGPWVQRTIPTCLEWYNSSLEQCGNAFDIICENLFPRKCT